MIEYHFDYGQQSTLQTKMKHGGNIKITYLTPLEQRLEDTGEEKKQGGGKTPKKATRGGRRSSRRIKRRPGNHFGGGRFTHGRRRNRRQEEEEEEVRDELLLVTATTCNDVTTVRLTRRLRFPFPIVSHRFSSLPIVSRRFPSLPIVFPSFPIVFHTCLSTPFHPPLGFGRRRKRRTTRSVWQ